MPLDPNHITAINKMLRRIGRDGIEFYRNASYAPWETIVTHHNPILNPNELDALIPAHDRLAGDLSGRSIAMKPSRDSNNAAALLRVEWNFDANPYMLKYYVLLYYGSATKAQPHLGISFRLEQPEAAGAHDFWHIQMCQRVASDRKTPVLAVHPQTPVSYPSFPLNAGDAVSLTASIPISMLGRPGFADMVASLTGQGPIVASLSSRYARGLS